MQDSIFREYDIRGKVGTELMLDQVEDLGRSIAFFLYQESPKIKKVLIGMDGRTTSPDMKASLTKALLESGLDVIFVGIVPSPVAYFGLFTMEVDACLVVTASHNPPEYNGIKIMLQKRLIGGDSIRAIGKLFREGKKVTDKKRGTEFKYDLKSDYIKWMVEHFPKLKNRIISAAIDTGNGTGGAVVPEMIKAFGWKNVGLFCGTIKGVPDKHEADPVVKHNMMCVEHALKEDNYKVGIGLDGDCDRMAAMTKSGDLIYGDRLLSIFAQQVLQEHPGSAIVFDIKSSSGLPELIQKWGGKPVVSPSGHSIIKRYMHDNSAFLGGELSCHFFFNDRYFGYDDGIYAMLRLFEMLVTSGKTLDELISVFPVKVSSPEFRIPCQDADKQPIIEHIKKYFAAKKDAQLLTIDGVRASLPYGWGIVRASNTQPVLSIRFEADTAKDLAKIKQEFIKAFGSCYDPEQLAKEFAKE